MATAAARFVSTQFSFAQLRDPTLLGNPCSAARLRHRSAGAMERR
jgi:hypothetical protein